jgi:hypothetical protein
MALGLKAAAAASAAALQMSLVDFITIRVRRAPGERVLWKGIVPALTLAAFRGIAIARALAGSARDILHMKMKGLVAIALLLIVAWVVLRVALAITSGLLHLLWIVALVMLCLWAWRSLRAKL